MNQGRVIPITTGAAASTFMLFYLMQGLVATEPLDLPDEPNYLSFDGIISEPTPPEVHPVDRVERPKQVEPPKFVDPVITHYPPHVINIGTGVGPEVLVGPDQHTVFDPGLVEGSQMPLVRVQPNYPPRALERGVEGWVTVEFTVSEIGDVRNAVVIEAEPKGYFESSALQAIAKFKYKPTVIDGRAVPTPGVRFRISYNLDN